MTADLKRVALAALLCLFATAGFATTVPTNTITLTNLWTPLGSNPLPGYGAAVASITSAPFTYDGVPITGTYSTAVYKYDAAGHLVFAFQFSLDPAPPNPSSADTQQITSGPWGDLYTVDAQQWTAPGQIVASGINRLNGVITMAFQDPTDPLITPGEQSSLLLLYTNATDWKTSKLGILDHYGATVDGFVPTPEPASLCLLGVGMLALGALRRKQAER